jgi:hypothetical protein
MVPDVELLNDGGRCWWNGDVRHTVGRSRGSVRMRWRVRHGRGVR